MKISLQAGQQRLPEPDKATALSALHHHGQPWCCQPGDVYFAFNCCKTVRCGAVGSAVMLTFSRELLLCWPYGGIPEILLKRCC